ncbi:MAG TPA: hypothetical protein PLF88_01800 [Opitutaceae bacterium]|nr:hypothetical protein [Opitutaceae bacterium]HRJ46134.1 hypothetical protein [Opitutaceae bacterium]
MTLAKMLFKQAILERIARGEVKIAFRRWLRPSVRPGTQLHTPVGLLAIEKVEKVNDTALTESSARASGYAGLDALREELKAEGTLYRITFRHAGADPRIALRENASVDATLFARLGRLDTAAKNGPWTRRVLQLIAAHPGKRAVELATRLGVDKEWFKLNVRKLKNLGLTESLETGYRISPRGQALLKRLPR